MESSAAQVAGGVVVSDFSADEPGIFEPIRNTLLNKGDYYMHLADLAGYVQTQEKVAAKLQQVLAQPERADKEEEATVPAQPAEQQRRHDQLKRLERQSDVTDNESAKMFTAPGVLQGYNSQALVDAKPQVIVPAEAVGNGQDYGQVPPRLEGAKAKVQALGLPAAYFAGPIFSADSNYHSEENLQPWAQEALEADSPDPPFRHRDPRFATQGRHHPPTEEKFTGADFTYDQERDCYRCPGGKVLKLKARRHQIGNNLFRRYEAEADWVGAAAALDLGSRLVGAAVPDRPGLERLICSP